MLVAVAECSGVAEARRLACQAAAQRGFCESDIGRIAIIATELATNLVKHARGGEIVIDFRRGKDERSEEAFAIVPKSEISQGKLRNVLACLAQEGNGARL